MNSPVRPCLVAVILLLGIGPLRAAPSIEQYFPRLSGFTFRLVSETARPDAATTGFSKEVLDDYILLSYSRWQVAASAAGSTMTLDVYEMHDAAGAFGLFSLWVEAMEPGPEDRLRLPVEHYARQGRLIFWRGNYAFRLAGEDFARDLESLVSGLSAAIPLQSLRPLTVLHLPRTGLRRESIRFYLGAESFELERGFPPELRPAVSFQNGVEVAAARYGSQEQRLVLIGYPTMAMAREHFVKLQKSLDSYFSIQGVFMKRAGLLVAIFFGPEADAEALLEQVRYVPTVKWLRDKDLDAILRDQREEALTFLGLLKRAMLFTFVFVVVALAGGLAAGLARYRILQRFPALTERDMPIELPLE